MAAQFAHAVKMELAETVERPGKKAKREKIAEVNVPVPTLADFGITAKQAVATEQDVKDGNAKAVGEPMVVADSNGVPVYEDPRHYWLQSAIIKAVFQQSRNKFLKGNLKPGMSLAEDFDALTAESARTGDALALRREAKADFEAYLGKLGKKAATVGMLSELFYGSNKVLSSAGEKYVEALGKYVGEWLDTLDDAKKTRFAPKIAELQESINAASNKEDLDSDL